MRLFITFTARTLPTDHPYPLTSPKGDVVIVDATPGEVFFVAYIINGRPPDPTKFIEATFGVKAKQTTTRFFGTTGKILEAARQGAGYED